MLLISSLKSCKSCCRHELLFNSLRETIKSDNNLKNVRIGRLELTQNRKFQEEFKEIKRYPFVMYFDGRGRHYVHHDIFDVIRIVRFLHRVINPV